MHVSWVMVTMSVGTAVYLTLAIYVVTQSPRQRISWVFGGFCVAVIWGFYLSSLFLLSGPEPLPSNTPPLVRWRHGLGTFVPTFFFHLLSYYFPPAWQKYRLWALRLAYFCGIGLMLAALFTDLLIAGVIYRPPPNIIGPKPGPLMAPYAGLFVIEVIIGLVGLILSYRAALSPSLRRQILYVLVPTGLAILTGIFAWIAILTQNTRQLLIALTHISLMMAAFFYARAVLLHGSFIGRPPIRRDLLYSAMGSAIGIIAIYSTVFLDRRLAEYTPFPLPLITSLLVIVTVVGFSAISRWVTVWLDKVVAPTGQLRRPLAHRLTETPAPDQLQAELLGALCRVLGVRGGYVAVSDPNLPADRLVVSVVQGDLPAQGDRIYYDKLVKTLSR